MRSLLFCQNEESAKLLTDRLFRMSSDVNIKRESSVYSAMRTLMTEQFDLLIVDVEDEQTARVLLKNAHRSELNKTALVVGVCAAQVGVNALRFGADFLITKPIIAAQAEEILKRVRALSLNQQRSRAKQQEAKAETSGQSSAHVEIAETLEKIELKSENNTDETTISTTVKEDADITTTLHFRLPIETPAVETHKPQRSQVESIVVNKKPTRSFFLQVSVIAALVSVVLTFMMVLNIGPHDLLALLRLGRHTYTTTQPAEVSTTNSTQVNPEPAINISSAPVSQAVDPAESGTSNSMLETPVADAENKTQVRVTPIQHTVKNSKPDYKIKVFSGNNSDFKRTPAVPLTATLQINSDPVGAAVWMDGTNTGRLTPTQISVKTASSHNFTLKKEGYLDQTIAEDISIGQTRKLNPSLLPLGHTENIQMVSRFKKFLGGADKSGMGVMNIKTQPRGAQIAVNGQILDKTSPAHFYLNPGNYEFDITLSDYSSLHRVVKIEEGGEFTIDEALERDHF